MSTKLKCSKRGLANVSRDVAKLAPEGWQDLKFWKQSYQDILLYLRNRERDPHCEVFPPEKLRLRALELIRPEKVKVVIIGQDPYHTPGVANGLAFSVQPHVKHLPPSLQNILKEYEDDLGYPTPRSGDLSWWSTNCGVLLLNTVLTVEARKPNSHAGKGWEKLTYEVIRHLSDNYEKIVFILWGKNAKQYRGGIDETKHFCITSGHPSPLAANAPDPFAGSKPFTKAMKYRPDLDWRLR